MKLFGSDWLKAFANQVVRGINSALAMSPGSQKHLKNLENCILKINLSGLESNFYFGVIKSKLDKLKGASDISTFKYQVQLVNATESPEVTVSGSPIAFIKLVSQKNKAILFQSKELKLEGDSVRIQQVLGFLGSLKIDWDGLLANFIGDIPAHLIGTSLRSGLIWGLNFSQSLIRDTEEFIKYELRLLPDKRRAKNQFTAIKALATDLEKLTKRFNQLEDKSNI